MVCGGFEAEPVARLGGVGDTLSRSVPVPCRRQGNGGCVAGKPVDALCQLPHRRLGAGPQIVDFARLALEGACHETAGNVVDEDEVAAGNAAIFHRQRLAMQRPPDEGRCYVAPDGMVRATPAPRAEHLARPVDILEPCLDEGHAVTRPVVVSVHLADQLGDGIGAVVIERHRRILARGFRAAERLFRHGAAGGSIYNLLQAPHVLQPLEQLQRRQRIVVVVGDRIGDGRLVAVIAGEVKDIVEVGVQAGERAFFGNAGHDEPDCRMCGDIRRVRREEVVDDGDAAWLLRQERPRQIGADEAGSAYHRNVRALEAARAHAGAPALRGASFGSRRWL